MSAIDKLDALQLIRKAEVINQTLLEIAKEKEPGKDPAIVLEGVIQSFTKNLLRKDTTYQQRMDAMAADMGVENFKAVLLNPDFQNIFNNWLKDYASRQIAVISDGVSKWSGDKVNRDDVVILFRAFMAAEEILKE